MEKNKSKFRELTLVPLITFGISSLLPGGDPPSAAAGAPVKPKPKSYYSAPKSYGTNRDPDVPKYAKPATESIFKDEDWAPYLDVGFDTRFRFEYRDDDIRRNIDGLDTPLLQRHRLFLGVHDIIDPFRFAFEIEDARRHWGDFPKDNRDYNDAEVIRLQAELYFKDALGVDDLGNPRPLMFRYGIQNFEFLDRRLLGNNQWRNTTNTFLGFRGALGQEKNDWHIDLLAVQPLERLISQWDKPVEGQWVYGAIGHWRGWSEYITIEPYYLAMDQEQTLIPARADRTVHSPGVRAYGQFGDSGFDFDFTGTKQFGHNGNRDIDASAATGEIGYSFDHAWNPRVSAFYGFATGDKDPTDNVDNRFERFFGFARPWSANDYIVNENIESPKLRVELTPAKDLRVDFGYSWFNLESSRDRFQPANLRDNRGRSGDEIGQEFDIRARYNVTKNIEAILGYAYIKSGEFLLNTQGREDTDFVYFELSIGHF